MLILPLAVKPELNVLPAENVLVPLKVIFAAGLNVPHPEQLVTLRLVNVALVANTPFQKLLRVPSDPVLLEAGFMPVLVKIALVARDPNPDPAGVVCM